MAAAKRAEDPPIETPDLHVHRDNPFCGDEVTIDLTYDEAGKVARIHATARGCLLVQAATGALAEAAPGHAPEAIAKAARSLRALLKDGAPPPGPPFADLAMFTPVGPTKSRHSCALLPFEAIEKALEKG
ncbi:MAG: iron-sulfur cluster assembly scaffold protein [Rhodospirillum sp.]|nr:iron-sulfur cluster assembly scaffold protein [Rhodospirillum sp.]MCF8488788.1 iron-sulfur cluster assembly scaffold protein [Rhodospirillum sp.]MCF8502228.1 iron-sulfur cluster assembly scaffold protein [Rhodospirillum sp.]